MAIITRMINVLCCGEGPTSWAVFSQPSHMWPASSITIFSISLSAASFMTGYSTPGPSSSEAACLTPVQGMPSMDPAVHMPAFFRSTQDGMVISSLGKLVRSAGWEIIKPVSTRLGAANIAPDRHCKQRFPFGPRQCRAKPDFALRSATLQLFLGATKPHSPRWRLASPGGEATSNHCAPGPLVVYLAHMPAALLLESSTSSCHRSAMATLISGSIWGLAKNCTSCCDRVL
jgi:hypothetical protein